MSEEQKPYNIFDHQKSRLEINLEKKEAIRRQLMRTIDNEIEKINVEIAFHEKEIEKLREERFRVPFKYFVDYS